MAKFKLNISDPTSGKTKIVELDGPKAVPLIGRKIGETLDGSVAGQVGLTLLITGGTDKDGFPMRPDVHGGIKGRVLLSDGKGYRSDQEGERRRKTVRGSTITEDILQVNLKVSEGKLEIEKQGA
ncbi:MAG: 30S ribosomal protein S6e [Candidatus Bathyarchaeia archaeon]